MRCAVLTGESYCLPLCPNGNECSASEVCLQESSAGEALSVCVPQAGTNRSRLPTTAEPARAAAGNGSGGSGGDSGGTAPFDAGTAPPLLFAAVGDTRGSLPFTSSYRPTRIHTRSTPPSRRLTPKPPFVVSTGDYAFELISRPPSASSTST
ncbi:MAG: hypothetical protein U0263_40900 [Polyangiaceae bacterium]